MKIRNLFILLLLFSPVVMGDVVISKVLYDPDGSEAGGEAVELWNMGEESVDVSGWVLSTGSSSKDATLPSVVLLPGQRFLLADVGWDEKKDNAEWRSADYEEKITLGNSDSGVALAYNNSLVDAVGWGDPEEYFMGEPASPADTGQCLSRLDNTGDNSVDFVAADCAFFEGTSVIIEVEVEEGFAAWAVSDDSNESGIQLNPGSPLIVEANGPGNVSFAGRSAELEGVEGSFRAEIDTLGLSAGSYVASVNGVSLDVEILPLAFVRVNKHRVTLSPEDTIVLENVGSAVAHVELLTDDLVNGDHKIDRLHVHVDGLSLAQSRMFSIKPGDSLSLRISLDDFGSVPPGRYVSSLRIIYGS